PHPARLPAPIPYTVQATVAVSAVEEATMTRGLRRLGGVALASTGGGALYGDGAARERAVRYNRQRQWLLLAGLAWTGATSAVALATRFSGWLRRRAEQVAPARLGPAMPYTVAATLASTAASLPLSYYSGYIVEHHYGLSHQTRGAWAVEQAKGLGVGLALEVPLAQGINWVIRRYPRGWWAILSALAVPFTIVLAQLAPVLILPLFNRFEPVADQALAERIKRLAAAQGVTVSDVLQMDMSKQTAKANAFFAGLGRTKRIVLADTLLNEFTPDETEVVLAHELGHQVHGDIWKLIGLGALTTTLSTWLVQRLAGPLIARYGRRFDLDVEAGAGDIAALPLLALLLGGVSLVLMPAQNAISRNLVERPADRYALELTGNAAAFVGAMEKLGRLNLADPQPSALVKYLLYSHPPIQERIDYGRAWRA
ncbi:MAG: M48 family metallopeptidase, partial [Thermomicrobiales bacterium]